MTANREPALKRLEEGGYQSPRDRPGCGTCSRGTLIIWGGRKVRVVCALHQAATLPGGWCRSWDGSAPGKVRAAK